MYTSFGLHLQHENPHIIYPLSLNYIVSAVTSSHQGPCSKLLWPRALEGQQVSNSWCGYILSQFLHGASLIGLIGLCCLFSTADTESVDEWNNGSSTVKAGRDPSIRKMKFYFHTFFHSLASYYFKASRVTLSWSHAKAAWPSQDKLSEQSPVVPCIGTLVVDPVAWGLCSILDNVCFPWILNWRSL